MPATQTIGSSPKKIAATVTAFVVPYIVGFAADKLGFQVDVSTATALIGPVVLAACTYAAAHFAHPGDVYVDQQLYPDAFTGPNPPAKVPVPPKKRPKPKSSPKRKKAAK